MPISAITIDFWNTLFDNSNGIMRNAERRGALIAEIDSAGYSVAEDAVDAAYTGIWDYFDRNWLDNQRTPSSREMVGEILRGLDVRLGGDALLRLVHIFEHGVLNHPPSMLDGVVPALEFLAAKAPLAIISDTAFSSGKQLRELMERTGIARYFTAYIFSDEIGVSKPHPDAFAKALDGIGGCPPAAAVHIGDIERTDIAGAHQAGMKAILYRGDKAGHKYVEDYTRADAIMNSWDEIQDILGTMNSSVP